MSSYLVPANAMLLLKLLPVFQPPHGRRWVAHGRAAELDGVGGWHGVEPLLHFVRVCPVGRPCSKGRHPENISAQELSSLSSPFHRRKEPHVLVLGTV